MLCSTQVDLCTWCGQWSECEERYHDLGIVVHCQNCIKAETFWASVGKSEQAERYLYGFIWDSTQPDINTIRMDNEHLRAGSKGRILFIRATKVISTPTPKKPRRRNRRKKNEATNKRSKGKVSSDKVASSRSKS